MPPRTGDEAARSPSLVVGGIATAANVAVQAVAQLAVVAFAARRVALADLGVYVTGVAVVMFVVAVESAVALAAVPVAARSAHDAGEAASLRRLHRLLLRWGAGAGALGVVLGAMTYATATNPIGRSVLVAQLGVAAAVYLASAGVRGTAFGFERYAFFSACNMAGQLANLAVAVVLVGRYGLAALGLGQLVAAVVSRGMLALGTRDRLRGTDVATVSARRWLPTVAALVLAVAGGQFVAAVSSLVIGFAVDADSAGVFRVSVQLPAQLMALVYQLADMLLPRLSRHVVGPVSSALEPRLARETALCAAAGLALLCLHRDAALRLVLGTGSTDGGRVVLVMSAMWLVNVPAHVAVLRLLALDAYRLLLPLIVVETALACALVSIGVPLAGIAGAAAVVAAVTMLSNAIGLPWRCRAVLPLSRFRGYVRAAALGTAEGAAAAAAAWMATRWAGVELVELTLHATLTAAGVAVVIAIRYLRRPGAVRPAG